MMAGRFGLAIPALACAGLFAQQRNTPSSVGTLRTDGLTFGIFLTVCLIVVTALSYLPSLVLGPVLEHLLFGIQDTSSTHAVSHCIARLDQVDPHRSQICISWLND
jgi:hypothetical protein